MELRGVSILDKLPTKPHIMQVLAKKMSAILKLAHLYQCKSLSKLLMSSLSM